MFFRNNKKKPNSSLSTLPENENFKTVLTSKTPPLIRSETMLKESLESIPIEKNIDQKIEENLIKEILVTSPESNDAVVVPMDDLISLHTPTKDNNNVKEGDIWFQRILEENKHILSLINNDNIGSNNDVPMRLEQLEKEISTLKTKLRRTETNLKTALDKYIEQKEKYSNLESKKDAFDFKQDFSSDLVRARELIEMLSNNVKVLERAESDEREKCSVLSQAFLKYKKLSDTLVIIMCCIIIIKNISGKECNGTGAGQQSLEECQRRIGE